MQHLTLPTPTSGFCNAEGDGIPGPLDLFVDVLRGRPDRGFCRTHVLPQAAYKVRATYERLDGKQHALVHPVVKETRGA